MPRIPKPGRTTHEIKTYPWPVVTKGMLGSGESLEPSDGQWNGLIKALVSGRIHLKNADLAARKALREAKDPVLQKHLKNLVLWLGMAQKEWPLSVVGE